LAEANWLLPETVEKPCIARTLKDKRMRCKSLQNKEMVFFFQMMFYIEALKLSATTNCEWKVHIPCTSPSAYTVEMITFTVEKWHL
jgi:hypothetical protein